MPLGTHTNDFYFINALFSKATDPLTTREIDVKNLLKGQVGASDSQKPKV
jgi:hypothetical protein